MNYRAIRFDPRSTSLQRCDLSGDSVTAFENSTAGARPAAFVVANGDLDALASSGSVGAELNDRGTKHPARGLKSLLLGRVATPVIRGSYTDPGQLTRSVRTFLRHAHAAGEDEVYVIGADAGVFEVLWDKARPSVRVASRPRLAPLGSGDPADASTHGSADLLNLLEPLDVPAALESRFLGRSRHAHLVRQLILRAARTAEPVLILGATGTGKELVARSVHDFGPRRTEPFIGVNCAGIPDALLESELFGHERGAFTGAIRKKPGLWRVAGRGTLFLDEIGDLSKSHQAKLLRALQEGHVRPIGADREVPVRARILAATNRDLYAMVRSGEFRDDLYYRLRSFLIETPSLRDQPEDIPVLASRFWRQVTGRTAAALPPDVAEGLVGRAWPGNARELRALLANLFALFGADDLDPNHLGAVMRMHGYDVDSKPPIPIRKNMVDAHARERLLRVEDLLRAIRATFAPITGRGVDETRVAEIVRASERRLEELTLLAPSRAGDEVLLEGVCQERLDDLRHGMISLVTELGRDVGAARRRFREDFSPRLDELADCLRDHASSVDQG